MFTTILSVVFIVYLLIEVYSLKKELKLQNELLAQCDKAYMEVVTGQQGEDK